MDNHINIKFNEDSYFSKKYNSNYWYYSGVLIPNNVLYVPSRDKINRISLHSETEAYSDEIHWTPKEYQEKFGILKSDGKIYWKKQ